LVQQAMDSLAEEAALIESGRERRTRQKPSQLPVEKRAA